MSSYFTVDVYKRVKDYSHLRIKELSGTIAESEGDGNMISHLEAGEVAVQHNINYHADNTDYFLNYVVWGGIPCYIPEGASDIKLYNITGSSESQQNIFLDAFPNIVTNTDELFVVKFRAFYNKPYLQSDNPNKYKEITLTTDKVNHTTTLSLGDEVDIDERWLDTNAHSVIYSKKWNDTLQTTCIELAIDDMDTRLQLDAITNGIEIKTVNRKTAHGNSASNSASKFMYIEENSSSMIQAIQQQAELVKEEIRELEEQINNASNYFITR